GNLLQIVFFFSSKLLSKQDLNVLNKEAYDRLTDMNKYALNYFTHYVPTSHQSLELIGMTDVDKSQRLFKNFVNIPFCCFKFYKMWFVCHEKIEYITKSLSDSIKAWQVFEVDCDTLQFICRHVENWLKEQSTWLVNEPEQVTEELELLRFVYFRLEVKFSMETSPKKLESPSQCLSSCQLEQKQRILELLDKSTSQVDRLNSTLKLLPNHRHQLLCSDNPSTLDENNLFSKDKTIATEIEVVTDSYDLALNRIKGLIVTFNHLQRMTSEISDLWSTRLKLLTEWDSKIQSVENTLSKLYSRMAKIKKQFSSSVSEESEKSTFSDENDTSETFITIEDNLTLVDDINKERDVISAEFPELRSRLCNLATFMNRNSHNNRQQRMGDLQSNWEELGTNLLNLQHNLEHRTTVWSDLILQVTNILNWFNEFNERMKVWHNSCPWFSNNIPCELLNLLSLNTSKDSLKISTLILNEMKRYSKDTCKFLKQCQSHLSLARAQHSKLSYYHSELNSSERHCTEIQMDAYNQLCNMITESVEINDQIESNLNRKLSIGDQFNNQLNQFITKYEACLSCINDINREFDQSISSMPKCDLVTESMEQSQEVQSLIKSRCLILTKLIEQIGDGKQLSDLLIDNFNEMADDKNDPTQQEDEAANKQNLIQHLQGLLKEANILDSFYHLDNASKSSDELGQHYAYCIARYLICESLQLREMLSHKLTTITNETEEQLKLDSALNYFEQQLKKCQDEMNQIMNLSIYRSKSHESSSVIDNGSDNTDVGTLPLKPTSMNADSSTLYWSHLKQSANDCENRINQLDNCIQCMIDLGKHDLMAIEQGLNNYTTRTGKLDLKCSHRFNELKSKHEINLNKMKKFKNQLNKEFESWHQFIINQEKAEHWLNINESLSKKVLYVVTMDDEQVHQQMTTETDDYINSDTKSERKLKVIAGDKELLSKQLTNLEQLEIDLKENGIELREHAEQAARNLLFNLIPNSMNITQDKQFKLNSKSEAIYYVNMAIESLLNRFDEYKVGLQTIHSNLSDKYLCWSKLDTNLEQMNRWLHTIELQVNTMEMETNSLSTILINDISVNKADDYFAVHQLNAWSNSKLCILTNLLDEMCRYSETELIQLKELVQAQNSIDQVFKEYSKDTDTFTSNGVTLLGQDASKRLNDINEQHCKLKSRLEFLINSNHVILNSCEKFVRKRCELFQWLISQRRELERLVSRIEVYGSQSSLQPLSTISLSNEIAKICEVFHKTTCDLETFKAHISAKYEEGLTDVIKLIEELGQMTPLRMEPAETYIMDFKRDITDFSNQITDKLEHFRVWSDKWSNFSLDCSTLIQWMDEQESFILSILNAHSSVGLRGSFFQVTDSDVVEKELNKLTDQVSRNQQFRIVLIGHQPSIESLVVKAQSLIKCTMFSSGACLSSDGECEASVKSLSSGNFSVGTIAMNIATNLMQRYQTLISICDHRSEASQTAENMIKQLLNSCKNYDQWAGEFRIKVSDVDYLLNSYDSSITSSQDVDKCSSIRLSVVNLETKIESGKNLVQIIKNCLDQYMIELVVQVNRRYSELKTLYRPANIDDETSHHDDDNKPENVLNYAETDYQLLNEMVQSLRSRFDKIMQNVSQRNLLHEKYTTWVETTESQLDLISSHINLSALSKIISEASVNDFNKLIDKVINYLHTSSESISELAIDIRKQSSELKNFDCIDKSLQNRFDQIAENIQSTQQNISNCLKLFHQFQNEVKIFSTWISDCENKFIRLSNGESDQLAIFFQSDSLTLIMNNADDEVEQIVHQLDISCRSSIYQLTEAKHKLLILKEISTALENQGHQLNKQLIESGEQLTSKLKILEEFSMGFEAKSLSGESGRSLSSLNSSGHLSVFIQNHIDQLQCRLIRLDKVQAVFTINLTELVDCWSDWKISFDRLIDWLNGTAINLRRPIFHSLDSLSTKQQLANSLKAFYQDCIGKKADFDLCLLKANHVKSLAPSCNLSDQSEQLFEQYKNTLDTAYAALQQMQNSVEVHEQFNQDVSRITQWLETLALKLNSLSTNENTDRVGLEQNLLICQNLSKTITCQSETYISQLIDLADQVCRTTDSMTNKEILDKVDVFRQLIRQNIQQLTDIQCDIEKKLNVINDWENAKSVVVHALDTITQAMLTAILEAKTSVEQVQPITSTILLNIKEESFKKFESIKQELELVQLKIDELKKCTEKYLEFEHKLNVMQQVNQLVEKYAKMQSEIEIRLIKTDKELQNLRVFHTKIDESKNWILQISLKLTAMHATDPDGPQGIIRLGQAENELRKRLIVYREQNLAELKSFIANCPSEKDLLVETDRVLQTLFQAHSGISIKVAEQVMENMNRINNPVQLKGENDDKNQLVTTKEDGNNTCSQFQLNQTLSVNDSSHTKTWAELFLLEVVQLESNCENLEIMCQRIKDRLMEQQQRWAKFVSVLIRIDKFLRIELVKWRLTNSTKFTNVNNGADSEGNAIVVSNVDNEYDGEVSIDNEDESLRSENSREVELAFYEENILLGKNNQPKNSQLSSPSIQELLAQITNVKAMHAKIQIYLQELSAVKHRCSTPPPRPTISTGLASLSQYYNPSTVLTELLNNNDTSQDVNVALPTDNVLLPHTTTAAGHALSSKKLQLPEEKMHALSGQDLRRRASHMNEQLEIELKRLDKYIETLQDLKVRWDQQNLCEVEFLNWLHQKQTEFEQAIHHSQQHQLQPHMNEICTYPNSDHHHYSQLYKAMDTVRLENLLNELHSKKTIIERLKTQCKSLMPLNSKTPYSHNIKLIEYEYSTLVKKIQENLNNRRLLTSQALEATKLTDKLHTSLHEVVKRSTGIDNVQCSINAELNKIGWKHPHEKHVIKASNQHKISKQPSFGVATSSSNHLLATSPELKQSFGRVSTPIPTSGIPQPVSLTNQSDLNIRKPLDQNVKGITDWLWYSASSILPDSSLLPADANETWEMDQLPTVFDVNHEQNLDRSRSSSRISLAIQRPWTAFRKLEQRNKRASFTEIDVNMSKDIKGSSKYKAGKVFSHTKPIAATQPSGTSLWRSQSAKVLPLETNMDKISSHSIWNISSAVDPFDDTNIACPERYSTQNSMIPMLLRRSISPIVSKTFGHRTDYKFPFHLASSVRYSGIVDQHSSSVINQDSSQIDPLTSCHRLATTTHSYVTKSNNSSLSHSFLFRPQLTSLSQQSLHEYSHRPSLHHSIRVSGLVSGYDFSSPSVSEFENVFCSGRPQPMGASISDNLLSPKVKPFKEQEFYDLTRRRATEPFQESFGSSSNFIQNIPNTSTSSSVIQQSFSNPIDSVHIIRPQTIAQLALQRYRNQQLQRQFRSKR
ncbi:Nesprin-1, partial [Schistosoma japonicum]